MSEDSKQVDLSYVYILDDDGEMRRSLCMLLKSLDLLPVSFCNAEEFLDRLELLSAAPILLDVRMPHVDGLTLMQELASKGIEWPVIIMTGHGDVPIAVKAMKLGAIEFLQKPFEVAALEGALELAFSNLEEFDRSNYERDNANKLLSHLTNRELEVINGIALGLSNKANAHALGVSVRTVEMHRRNAMNKLGMRNIADLVRLIDRARLT